MNDEPIIVPNVPEERVEYAVEWTFPAGHRTYTLGSFSRAECEKRIATQDRPGVVGKLVQCSAFTTPNERVDMQRLLLREAEEKLGALIKACLTTKTTLDKPYSDAPETTPWKQFVEQPAKDADFLRTEIRKALAWRTAGRAPTCAKCGEKPLPGTELCNLHTPLKGNIEVRGGGRS